MNGHAKALEIELHNLLCGEFARIAQFNAPLFMRTSLR
jgi:hypothetical protein